MSQASKIVTLEIQNFMSIGYAKFAFDESNIINLVGYNDSGKSAVTRALEVILYDSYHGLQSKFIRDDTAYFGIGLEFDDGVSVNRYKYRNGKSVWEMEKDGVMLYTNELASGIAAVEGVPLEIAKYLGVAIEKETKNKLNVRRNTDKLFLIETSGGENYKIINNFLRYDVLSNATAKLNADRNRMQSDYSIKITRRDTLRGEANSIEIAPTSVIEDMQQSASDLNDKKNQLSYLLSLAEKSEAISKHEVYPELETVDMTRLYELQQLASLMENLSIDVYDEVETVDTERLSMLLNMSHSAQNLNIDVYEELPTVETNRLSDLMAIGNSYTTLYHSINNANNVETEYQGVKTQLEELSKQYGFKICRGCGSVVA